MKNIILLTLSVFFLFSCSTIPKRDLPKPPNQEGFVFGNISEDTSFFRQTEGASVYLVNVNDIPKKLYPYFLNGKEAKEFTQKALIVQTYVDMDLNFIKNIKLDVGTDNRSAFFETVPVGEYVVVGVLSSFNVLPVRFGNPDSLANSLLGTVTYTSTLVGKGTVPTINVTEKGVYLGSYHRTKEDPKKLVNVATSAFEFKDAKNKEVIITNIVNRQSDLNQADWEDLLENAPNVSLDKL